MRKLFLSSLLALAIGIGAAEAQVVVKIAPPHAPVERHGVAPSREHVWINGYHKWDGRAYVWEPGRWEKRPRPHAVWVAPRWVHQHNGWVLVEGRWR
jgi:hypothetical protein